MRIVAKRRIDYSHRKRVVGGFYAYEHHTEFADLGELCARRTDARGTLVCEPKIDVAGNVYLLAEAKDAQGNVARAGTSYWVAGAGDTWYTAGNDDRSDVIPENRSYAPGEKARVQVRLPFREATALVSVEAGGIIETVVHPLSRYKPYIELPVKAEWGPNVFVSVLAVRGRVQPLKWYSFFEWGWREPVAWFKEWWNAGFVGPVDVRALGLAVVALGGGRQRPGDAVDPRVGLAAVLAPGATVQAGDALAQVHAASVADADTAVRAVTAALPVVDLPAPQTPLLLDRVRA